ncbi:SDR family NAD(P)-dependent oxidoreductase [Thalassorhabdomicrobium marinisediminis]|uniref:Short-chain dehydrogenase n=1 Tax=Thalassorhabdomicrobium marinisediminis TaxID=2170577 RepID=A0A2T7FU85_9RHOB|nr:SDR family oxidoreductase [Thalassorhabdomicrobium marinisediminis]PVA05730.1 short-chain dehydrogenase [Thalassorhabdomicrobium marinisediminis]
MSDKGTVLVVGGSGGIGAVICATLAAEGWDVALTYRSGKDKAERAADTVRDAGRRASAHRVDLAEAEAARDLIEQVLQDHGRLDGLVYAAGPMVRLVHLSRTDPALMESHLMQDTLGFFRLAHAALPALREAKGAVVACHSAAQYRYAPADGLSIIPKAAVTATMHGIAKEEGRFGVRANGVAIGLIEAGQHDALSASGEIDEAYLEAAARATPLRRAGQPEDIAHAVAFFVDPRKSGFVTGQTICVDGGYSV